MSPFIQCAKILLDLNYDVQIHCIHGNCFSCLMIYTALHLTVQAASFVLKMKVSILLYAMTQAATVKHDIEAMVYCQGKTEGFYENPAACDNYFFCWNQGKLKV